MRIVVLPLGVVESTFWAIVRDDNGGDQLWCAAEVADRAIALLPEAEVLRLPGGLGSAAHWLALRGLLPPESQGMTLDEVAALCGVRR